MLQYLEGHGTKWVALLKCQTCILSHECFLEGACNCDKKLMFNTTIIYSEWKQDSH